MVFYLFNFSCPMKTKSFGISLNGAKWNRGLYLLQSFLFFFFFLKKNWYRHAKFSHKCAKWSKGLFLLPSLRWFSHSHAKCSHDDAKCSHDDAKWSKDIKFLQLSLSVLHSHANWDKDSFFAFSKLWKLPCFWHEFSCFCMNVQNGDGPLKLLFPCFMHSIHPKSPSKHKSKNWDGFI